LALPGLAITPLPGATLAQHRLARLWGWICLWGSGCPVRIVGLDRVDPDERFIIVVNHQSALDIPLLMAVIPADWRTVFWAKKSLFRIPVLGWAMRELGHMPIDRVKRSTAGRMLSHSATMAAERRSLLVFPEATYSPGGVLLPFRRGGFVLALKTGMPILPVGIRGTREALAPRRLTIRHALLTIRFGEPIVTEGLGESHLRQLMDRTHDTIADLLVEG
jgi:1-acyl-sn-glycerol-3-phosphate acyltransferase